MVSHPPQGYLLAKSKDDKMIIMWYYYNDLFWHTSLCKPLWSRWKQNIERVIDVDK